MSIFYLLCSKGGINVLNIIADISVIRHFTVSNILIRMKSINEILKIT